ncbi:MAG: hypothetical protein WCU88_03610 [Elusimicrobiota bacterium]|jgi:hypothetical protein
MAKSTLITAISVLSIFALSTDSWARKRTAAITGRDESYQAVILSSDAVSVPQEKWEELKASEWGFSLRVPPGAKLTATCGESPYCLQVWQRSIQAISDADGVCSSSRQELAREQREAIRKIRSPKDAQEAVELTNFGISSLAGFRETAGVKVAYGLQDCQGDVLETDIVGWYVGVAIFYQKDVDVQFKFAFQPQETIPVGKSSAYLDDISTKRHENDTRTKWEFFERIVASVKAAK